ncbi:MAG: carbohydrate ABC transporter permease [Christensenellales bacterium]|jgi:putative aldouronate transport system permease protein
MRESLGERIFNIVNVLGMCILVVVTLYPLLYVLFVSFSVPSEYMRYTGNLIFRPIGFSLTSYKVVFRNSSIWTGYKNTLFVVVVGTTLNMLMTIVGAYVLSRRQIGMRRFLTLMTLFTRYFSGGMIPTYLVVRNIGLYGSLWALIIPAAVNTFNLIIMRTAFETVPDSLEESAKIDGASQLVILIRIMVPLVVPTIAVLLLYYGVSHWNSWFSAMLYIRKRELYPLQLLLREMIIQNTVSMERSLSTSGDDDAFISETIKYSTIVVVTLPILLLYPFLQKYFVKGVMVGAVKG